jgi:glutaconate CoA-transferase, subunit B
LAEYTAEEMMTVAAARRLADGDVCLVGIGLPSLAANLARRLHAPSCVLIYESGTIGSKPATPPLSIGDGELADTADTVVSVPEIFNYWLQAGRIDVGFLGAAQIDRHAVLNTTVIGDYASPQVRLPGAGGAPEIASSARRVIVVLRHSRRAFVEQVDFRTSVPGPGPTVVITDLGELERAAPGGELVLTAVHPGVAVDGVRGATGWDLQVAGELGTTPAPTAAELAALRALTAGRPA